MKGMRFLGLSPIQMLGVGAVVFALFMLPQSYKLIMGTDKPKK